MQDEKSQQRSWEEIVQQIAMGALLRITALQLTYIHCYGNRGSADALSNNYKPRLYMLNQRI